MSKINFGILGAGFGERVMYPCINFNKNMKVKYIFCRNIKKIKNIKAKNVITNNYKKVFTNKKIDIICIETPPSTHKFFVNEAIKNKKGIMCEKPLALNTKDAMLMIKGIKKEKLFACENHQLRFHPNITKIKELINKNYLGKINYITINHHTNMLDERASDNWWFNKKLGGGQLYAIGSHLVDLIQFLNGKIEYLNSHQANFLKMKNYKNQPWKKKIDTYFSMICKFSNGSAGSINSSCVTNTDRGLNIIISGEKRTVEMKNFDNLFLYTSNGKIKNISAKDKLRSFKVIGLNPWRTSQVYYLKHIAKFLKKKENFIGATFQDGLRTQKVLEGINISSIKKKFIKIK